MSSQLLVEHMTFSSHERDQWRRAVAPGTSGWDSGDCRNLTPRNLCY